MKVLKTKQTFVSNTTMKKLSSLLNYWNFGVRTPIQLDLMHHFSIFFAPLSLKSLKNIINVHPSLGFCVLSFIL